MSDNRAEIRAVVRELAALAIVAVGRPGPDDNSTATITRRDLCRICDEVAEQAAEIARLTAERDAAADDRDAILAGDAARIKADRDAYRIAINRIAELRAAVAAAGLELAAAKAKIPPKQPMRLFGPARARFDERGRLWLLDPAKGWAGTGFLLDGWDDLFRRFAVRVTHHGADAEGPFWAVENTEERAP